MPQGFAGLILNPLYGDPEQAIGDYSNSELARNRAALGEDAQGNVLPAPAPGTPPAVGSGQVAPPAVPPAPPGSGMLPADQEPNATKTPQSWGSLMMDLQRSNERTQGLNQSLGLGFAAFAQPRDREMVSKVFNVDQPDPLKTVQGVQNMSGLQQSQDRMNALGQQIMDSTAGPAMAQRLNISWDELKARYRADPAGTGTMIQQFASPTDQMKNLQQIQAMQQAAAQKGANSSEIALLTPALIAQIGGPASEKAIEDSAAYRASHKGQTAPWVTPAGVDIQKYNQYVEEQKTISGNQADAGSTFQGSTDTLNTLRQKLGNLKSDPDLGRILSLPQDSLEKNAFQEALRNQNADWKDKIPQVLLLDPGAMRVLSDMKEATGQEYTGALDSILGHGLRPTAQEIAQVRAGYGQTPNILNFSNIKDYNAQAIDPMLTRMDQALAKAYGDTGQIDAAPANVKPFINPIYLHGGKYHLDDGTDTPDWERNINKPMSAQDVQEAKAAIKANPANSWHVVDAIRRKGYDTSPLAVLPGSAQ